MGQLDHLRRQLERKAAAASAQAARSLEADLKRAAPVESGDLRDSITVTSAPTATGAVIRAEVAAVYAWRMRNEFDREVSTLPARLQRAWNRVR